MCWRYDVQMHRCIRTPLPFNTLKWGLLRLAPTIYFSSTCGVMFFLFLTIFEANQTPTGKTIFTYVMILVCSFVFVFLFFFVIWTIIFHVCLQVELGDKMDVVEGFLFYITTTKLSNLHCSCTWGLYEVHNFLMIWKIKGTFEAVRVPGAVQGGDCPGPESVTFQSVTAKRIPEFLIVTTFQYCIPQGSMECT